MSYFPQIYNRLYATTRSVQTINEDITVTASNVQLLMDAPSVPRSIVVPVMSTTLSAFTNDIFMDHNRLPSMEEFRIGENTVNAHNLGNNEFMYVCYNQYAQGTFHLIGEPGLFSLGFSTLVVSPDPVPDMGIDIVRQNSGSYAITLKRFEYRNVFLGQGDFFKVFCTLPEGASSQSLDGLMSNFTITRLSRNTGYSHPVWD